MQHQLNEMRRGIPTGAGGTAALPLSGSMYPSSAMGQQQVLMGPYGTSGMMVPCTMHDGALVPIPTAMAASVHQSQHSALLDPGSRTQKSMSDSVATSAAPSYSVEEADKLEVQGSLRNTPKRRAATVSTHSESATETEDDDDPDYEAGREYHRMESTSTSSSRKVPPATLSKARAEEQREAIKANPTMVRTIATHWFKYLAHPPQGEYR
jgi:hypothetical protein